MFEVSDGEVRWVAQTICLATIHSLRFRLPSAQLAALETRHSKVPAALNSYLLGQYLAAKRDGRSLAIAIEHYRKATMLDPQYALAYAGLGGAYTMIANKGIIKREEAFGQADAMADEALRLNPGLPEAHLVKGSNLQRFHWKWSDAEHHFHMAAKIAPQLALAHHWYAGLLSMLGRHTEALAEARIAKELDPLSPSVQAAYGSFLYRAGDREAASEHLEWLVQREPEFANAHGLLAAVYGSQKKFTNCIASADRFNALSSGASFSLSVRGYALALAGRADEAQQAAIELAARYWVRKAAASEVAAVHLGLLDTAQVFYWLDRAFHDHDDGLTTLLVDPAYSELHGDARFQTLIEKLQCGG
jgi:tetratricopeptide (TPR) repeat protein